jgi:hypothetical protein
LQLSSFTHRLRFFPIAFIGLWLLFAAGCRDRELNESPDFRLSFSTDTVVFDTVFTTVGSATRILKVYNRGKAPVRISRIVLQNDPNNSYRINVDGLPGTAFADVEILGRDSMFIFVEVTVQPNQDQLYPFVDGAIRFEINGNAQQVKLVSWGWDAIFYYPTVFPTNGLPRYTLIDNSNPTATVTWTPDKPIVVYGYVVVDSLQTLIVQAGTQVFFHQSSGLWVYRNGNIQVNGTPDMPVVFQGDRLEPFYQEQPGQWDRIWINEGSTDNVFRNAIIKNSFIGLQAETLPFSYNIDAPTSANKLQLENVVIRNNSIACIFSRNYRIHGVNVLASRAGQYVMAGTGGGEYRFDHCTFANNWNLSIRQTPSLFITNLVQVSATTVQVRPVVNSRFRNCILTGNGVNEFALDFNEQVPADIQFTHCLLRGEQAVIVPFEPFFTGDIFVGNTPGFRNFTAGDFRLREDAFVRGKGTNIGGPLPTLDLIGTPYATPRPLGCLEYTPE